MTVVFIALTLVTVAALVIAAKQRHAAVEARYERDVTQRDLAYWQDTHPYTQAQLQASGKKRVNQSRGTSRGLIVEQLAPFLPELITRFNPQDMHFIGKPVDYVVFNGLTDGGQISIDLLEIKTGKAASLEPRERRVQDACIDRRVTYQVAQIDLPQMPEVDWTTGIGPAS